MAGSRGGEGNATEMLASRLRSVSNVLFFFLFGLRATRCFHACDHLSVSPSISVCVSVCVCTCVGGCKREREREREAPSLSHRPHELHVSLFLPNLPDLPQIKLSAVISSDLVLCPDINFDVYMHASRHGRARTQLAPAHTLTYGV